MKLHVLRQNQDVCCWFLLFDKWKQLMLMFCLLPFNTFNWNCIYVTLTQAFYAWQRASYLGIFLSNWCFADPWSQDWVRSGHVKEKPSDRSILQGRWNQLEQEKIIRCPFFGCKHGINEVGDHIHFLLNFRQNFHQFWRKFWWFEFSIEFSPNFSPILVTFLVNWRNWWVFEWRKCHQFWWQ